MDFTKNNFDISKIKKDDDVKRLLDYVVATIREALQRKTNTDPKEITFIGNGDNDEYVYLSGCHTICINPHKKTNYSNSTIWHKVINDSTNMKDILPYLNINKIKSK